VDDQRIGEQFLGMDIRSPNMLPELVFDKIIITAMNSGEAIMENVLSKGIPQYKVALVN
jgi:hypothetical protein